MATGQAAPMREKASTLARTLWFLGRVKFTMILLVGGALIMTVGTVLESRQGRDAAWSHVYGAAWFDVFLVLIAVNLILSVVIRIPIQRHQWGFVVTHLAIVLLLVGAWISHRFGYEGRLIVHEGSSADRIWMDALRIDATWGEGPEATKGFVFERSQDLGGRALQAESGDRPAIRIVEHVANGVAHESLAPSEDASEPPGVEVVLTSAAGTARDWMITDHPRHGYIAFGPLDVALVQGVLEPGSPKLQEAGIVIAVAPDGTLQMSRPGAAGPEILEAEVGRPVPLGKHDTALTVSRALPHAEPEVHVEPLSGGEGTAFVRVEAARGGERRDAWLALGDVAHWRLAGQAVSVAFENDARRLPFSVALQEFKIDFHPGSGRPRQYESRVAVKSPSYPEGERAYVISMNRPLDVDGFRLFQSSYQLGRNGGPDATVLSVSHDPGTPLVYVSFVLVVVGIAWYMKRRMPDRGPIAGPGTPAALLAATFLASAPSASDASMTSPGSMPVERTPGSAILAEGRVKPLQTYASDTARTIAGRQTMGPRSRTRGCVRPPPRSR